jgi:nucleoid-associated protein YgaU
MKKLETNLFEIVLLVVLVAFEGYKIGYIMAAPPVVYTNQAVVVHHGDTIWSIAESMASNNEDVRDVVHRICKANSLKSKIIHPGQKIIVPVK